MDTLQTKLWDLNRRQWSWFPKYFPIAPSNLSGKPVYQFCVIKNTGACLLLLICDIVVFGCHHAWLSHMQGYNSLGLFD